MTQPALFETKTEEQILTERAEKIDSQIAELLSGHTPFAFPVNDQQRELLRLLRFRRGMAKAVSIAEITARTGMNARLVKDLIRSLVVDYRVPIGASRDSETGGYYLVMTPAEAEDTARPYIREGVAMFRRAQVFLGTRAILDLRGQLAIEEEIHHTAVKP